MERIQNDLERGSGSIAVKMEELFLDNDIDVQVECADGECHIEMEGINDFTVVFVGDEIIVDYIESDSMTLGVATKAVEVLVAFAQEYGYSVRASNVLDEAIPLWERCGFVPEGGDYVYGE